MKLDDFVYITKYALLEGIQISRIIRIYDNGLSVALGVRGVLGPEDTYPTLEEVRVRVETMRLEAITKLHAEVERLGGPEFAKRINRVYPEELHEMLTKEKVHE